VIGVLADGFPVVQGRQAPRGRVVAPDDGVGDRDARPVEVTVVPQSTAVGRDRGGEAVEGGRRLAFCADERPRSGAEVGGGAAKDGGVLADMHGRLGCHLGKHRHGDELLQRDVEGHAAGLGVGEPLPQAVAAGRQVEHEDAAGQVVHDHAVRVPEVTALLGRHGLADAGADGECAQDQSGQRGAVVERLGVAGRRRRELGQLDRLGSALDDLEHAGRLADPLGLGRVDQPGQRAVGGDLGQPRLIPVPIVQKAIFYRTDRCFASVRQPSPLGGAVLERRSDPFEQIDEPAAGGLADGSIEVGQADADLGTALGSVADEANDRFALRVVWLPDGDRRAQVAPRPFQRPAGGCEQPRVFRPGVPARRCLIRHRTYLLAESCRGEYTPMNHFATLSVHIVAYLLSTASRSGITTKPPRTPPFARRAASSSNPQLRHDSNARFFTDRGSLFRRRYWFVATCCPPVRIVTANYQSLSEAEQQRPVQVRSSV